MPVYHDYSLAPLSWFRTGGNADLFMKADSLEELQTFMRNHSKGFNVLGNGSNTLVRDGGVREPVLKLGRGFRSVIKDGNRVTVGAACLNRTVVEQTCLWELSGLEFLIGIPGSIGGAVAMNAGACGSETKDVLRLVQICLPSGDVQTVDAKSLNMTYRHAVLPEGAVIISAVFELMSDDPVQIRQRINTYLEHRDSAQPISGKTGGSTFKNPEGHKAWELIDAVGLRGYQIGGATFSEKHCNFIMNTDGSAADIEELGNLAQTRVREKMGIELEWEIKRIGQA